MRKTPEEIAALVALARAQGCGSVEVDGLKFELATQQPATGPVPEREAQEIVAPLSALDEYSDEEILYYSTSYFDELQKRKEAHKHKLAEETELKRSHTKESGA